MSDESSAPLILVATDGPVTTLALNRPAKRNALNVALLEQLVAAVTTAEADKSQRVLVLRGEGPAFCAGLDLAEAADPEQAHRSAGLIARGLQVLGTTRLVTIAAVHGAAIAGGAGLMSACDLAIAAQGTQIGYPEPRRGLVAALVMTFLRRQLRERDARELLLTGELIDASRAVAIGLVNREVPAADLLPEAQRFAAAVLAGGPEAVANTKRLLAELWPVSVQADLDRALAFHLEARQAPEAAEGIAAFREKRPPRWAPP
ncbi:MAG: enoyl-CoA hydratase/isomerase family protein [Verrucomicrobiota bacterium]